MKIKLEKRSSHAEFNYLFERLLKTPHKLEVKMGRRVVSSNIVWQKNNLLVLSEFNPFYANSLVKTLKRIQCTIKELDGFEEVNYIFTARFDKETEVHNIPGYQYIITSSIRGYKKPYEIKPQAGDDTTLHFSLGDDEYHLAVKAMTYEEVFLFGNYRDHADLFDTDVTAGLGIPSKEPGRNQQLDFTGRFTHIYGHTYSLDGVTDSEENRLKMMEYTKKNFIRVNNIQSFDRDGHFTGGGHHRGEKQILLVSDIELIQKTFERSFTVVKNIGVIARGNSQALLGYCQNFHPDAIFLDIDDEGLDIASTFKTLRTEGIGIPVIVLTVSGKIKELRQAVQAGASGYFLKPIDSTMLIRRAKALLGLPKPKLPFTLIDPTVVYYCEDRTTRMDLIAAMYKQFGNIEELYTKGLKVLDSFSRAFEYCQRNGADLLVLGQQSAAQYSLQMVESIRKNRLSEHLRVVVIPSDDDDRRLVEALNDEKTLIISYDDNPTAFMAELHDYLDPPDIGNPEDDEKSMQVRYFDRHTGKPVVT